MAEDVFADIEAAVPDNTQLSLVSALVKRQLDEQKAVEAATTALAKAQAALKLTEETDLPNALIGCGITKFETTEGAKVELKTSYHASIPADRKPQAFAWLDNHGHGAIIKHEITIKFPRDSGNQAARCVDLLKMEFPNLPVDDKESVHPATLSSLVKELMGQSKEVAMDLLGVFTRRYAAIKLPKSKKDEL
jgi:hypothetical protein